MYGHAHVRLEKEEPAVSSGFLGGASRARTGDLDAASVALSQLSYGPTELPKCSAELEILSPIDAESLIVAAPRQAQIDLRTADYPFARKVVAPIELGRVGGEGVDLARRIGPLEKADPAPPGGITTDDDHVAAPARELALHANQAIAEVEDEVVALVGNGFRDANPQFHRGVDDCRLSDRPLLVGRELHALDRSRGLGWAVA